MINLSDNTNRWGAPPSAIVALGNSASLVRDYPEPDALSLRQAIAEYLEVSAEMVATGCGSDGVLDGAMRAFATPGDRVAIPEPTFTMAAIFARLNALEPVLLPLSAEHDLEVEPVLACAPRIVYLCSPNNPLGAVLGAPRVAELAMFTDATVIVDEAYAEFSGSSLVPLVGRFPNLLVVRTMSKAFGLAGARVGYAVGRAELVSALDRVRGPFAVNAPGGAAACAALRNDAAWMREHVAAAIAERERLADELRRRGLDPLPSAANFLLVPIRNARTLAASLRARGVAVRTFSALRPVSPALVAAGGDAIRVTVGPRTEMDAFLNALDSARREALACA